MLALARMAAVVASASVLASGCGGGNGDPAGPNPNPNPNPNPPQTATVQAGVNSAFSPAQVTVARNGTVTWVFAALTHNVTFAQTTGAPQNIGESTNESISRSFGTAGTFNYTCTLHPGMNGSVTVQ